MLTSFIDCYMLWFTVMYRFFNGDCASYLLQTITISLSCTISFTVFSWSRLLSQSSSSPYIRTWWTASVEPVYPIRVAADIQSWLPDGVIGSYATPLKTAGPCLPILVAELTADLLDELIDARQTKGQPRWMGSLSIACIGFCRTGV